MVLVDTSVWIRWFRSGSLKDADQLLTVVTCSPILQEIMQGFDELPAHGKLRTQLLSIPRLADPIPVDMFLSAADIYRTARRKGYKIRSSVDCVIAAIAIQNDVPLMHVDGDFDAIACFTQLRIAKPFPSNTR